LVGCFVFLRLMIPNIVFAVLTLHRSLSHPLTLTSTRMPGSTSRVICGYWRRLWSRGLCPTCRDS
jgi:hypothetical protein